MLFSKDEIQELGVAVATFAAGLVVKKTLEKGYKKVYKKDPPDKRTDEEPEWLDLVAWTIATGLAASAVKTLIRRKSIKKRL
ncbi:MAG: DUF4235 domain-containing protein [Bacteroidetes bacterium]|jgi:hypothetical protein|nr:DUF4235 domain-containing protein [Bacteroidota bacterium]